jgi:hypothetical protein
MSLTTKIPNISHVEIIAEAIYVVFLDKTTNSTLVQSLFIGNIFYSGFSLLDPRLDWENNSVPNIPQYWKLTENSYLTHPFPRARIEEREGLFYVDTWDWDLDCGKDELNQYHFCQSKWRITRIGNLLKMEGPNGENFQVEISNSLKLVSIFAEASCAIFLFSLKTSKAIAVWPKPSEISTTIATPHFVVTASSLESKTIFEIRNFNWKMKKEYNND